jgi:hypothetical protein
MPPPQIRHVIVAILGLILIFSFASTHDWKSAPSAGTCVSPSHPIIAHDAKLERRDREETKNGSSSADIRPGSSPPPSGQALLSKPTYSKRYGIAWGSPSPSPSAPARDVASSLAPSAPPASGVDIADVWNLSSRMQQDRLEPESSKVLREGPPIEPPLFHAEGESAGPAAAAGPDRLDSIVRRKQRRGRRPLLRRTALAAAAAVTLGLPAGAAVFYLAGRADMIGTSSKEAGAEGDAGAAAP